MIIVNVGIVKGPQRPLVSKKDQEEHNICSRGKRSFRQIVHCSQGQRFIHHPTAPLLVKILSKHVPALEIDTKKQAVFEVRKYGASTSLILDPGMSEQGVRHAITPPPPSPVVFVWAWVCLWNFPFRLSAFLSLKTFRSPFRVVFIYNMYVFLCYTDASVKRQEHRRQPRNQCNLSKQDTLRLHVCGAVRKAMEGTIRRLEFSRGVLRSQLEKLT